MITLYSGTPGSGKSYHAARDLYERFDKGGGFICNFPVKVDDSIKPKKPLRVSYWDNSEITPARLAAYALKYHTMGVEGQTLVVIDEAQVVYNSREFTAKGRMDWIKFFSQHRKLGYDILMIAQNDRMIDKQIRMLIEIEVKHRKLNNYGFGGSVLSLVTGKSTWFIAIEYWYGGNKLCLGREMIRYRRKIAEIYDSYRMFEDSSGDVVFNDKTLRDDLAALRLQEWQPRGLLVPFVAKRDKPEAGKDTEDGQQRTHGMTVREL